MDDLDSTSGLYFVMDVESIGLHGEGFAAAFVLVDRAGREVDAGCFACPPDRPRGRAEDRAWVAEHVSVPNRAGLYDWPANVRQTFCDVMAYHMEQGATVWADCAWPVEAEFLSLAAMELPWLPMPYPLHDVATALLLAGRDPTATHERLPSELPAHDPLADARQSARLLIECLDLIAARANRRGGR